MTFTACLNVEFDARDADEAVEIMRVLGIALKCTQHKVKDVEIDDIEEL